MSTLPTTPRSPWGGSGAVAEYLEELKAKTPVTTTGTGRLIFALDATASRQPTWDHACHIQGSMFDATAALGGLDVKLTFYRGYDECKSSRWLSTAADLHRVMRSVSCIGGNTQIERVLEHAITETTARKVNALIFVGDAQEEKVDRLCHLAGQLGALETPVFMFQEGSLPDAEAAFKQIAALSKGAYLPFDLAGIDQLKGLLGAIAVFATGGYQALEAHSKKKLGNNEAVLRLTAQLKR